MDILYFIQQKTSFAFRLYQYTKISVKFFIKKKQDIKLTNR